MILQIFAYRVVHYGKMTYAHKKTRLQRNHTTLHNIFK